jgi:hypothetical protein
VVSKGIEVFEPPQKAGNCDRIRTGVLSRRPRDWGKGNSPATTMPYRITAVFSGERSSYSKETLAEAAYLAAKMADQGGTDVKVFDDDNCEVDTTNAPLPPGWIGRPFKER